MKRAVIVLSATLLALEAAAIPLRRIDAAPVTPPEPDTVPVKAPEEIVTGVCDFGGCPVAANLTKPKTLQEDCKVTTSQDLAETSQPEEMPEPVWFPDEEPEEVVWEATRTAEVAAEAYYSPEYFCNMGLINWGGWTWSWYSELVLPGGGLDIPGRHTSGGYVMDGDGYICLASDVLDYGTVVATPFGSYGKVYDCGVGNDNWIDVYVSW